MMRRLITLIAILLILALAGAFSIYLNHIIDSVSK